jgi:hypothetical protein
VLDGSTDPTAPSWKQASAEDLLHRLNAMGSGDARALDGELRVRQVRAYKAAASESADTGRKLVRLTWAIVALTAVLVALTIVLGLQ